MALINRAVQQKSVRSTDIYPNESYREDRMSDMDESKGQENKILMKMMNVMK